MKGLHGNLRHCEEEFEAATGTLCDAKFLVGLPGNRLMTMGMVVDDGLADGRWCDVGSSPTSVGATILPLCRQKGHTTRTTHLVGSRGSTHMTWGQLSLDGLDCPTTYKPPWSTLRAAAFNI